MVVIVLESSGRIICHEYGKRERREGGYIVVELLFSTLVFSSFFGGLFAGSFGRVVEINLWEKAATQKKGSMGTLRRVGVKSIEAQWNMVIDRVREV